MDQEQFRAYQVEVVESDTGAHGRLAALLGTSEIGVKRYATGGRYLGRINGQHKRTRYDARTIAWKAKTKRRLARDEDSVF